MRTTLPNPKQTIQAAYESCTDNLHDQSRAGSEIEACFHHDQALGTLLTEITTGSEGYIYHHLEVFLEHEQPNLHPSTRALCVKRYLASWKNELITCLVEFAGKGEAQ